MNDKLKAIDVNKLVVVLFFGALVILLLLLTRAFPAHLRASALIATAIGIVALLFARAVHQGILKELLRDIGIAFIVAVVVTVVYEYSTRSLEERETMLSVIDKAMTQFVPEEVWGEVKQEILQRQRIRRNVTIDMKILRGAKLSTGKYITVPPGQVILWMKYGYDLYGMTAGGSDVAVQHQLGFEMWNPKLDIPRFESISVIGQEGRPMPMYVGNDLQRIDDGKGTLQLVGQDIVHLPAPGMKQPVRVTSERYELMNVPGSYSLVMPELTASSNESQDPTIKVTISEVPWDIDTELNTYYSAHTFTQPDRTKNVWVYNKIVLPGQGFTLVVKPKFPPTNESAVSPQ